MARKVKKVTEEALKVQAELEEAKKKYEAEQEKAKQMEELLKLAEEEDKNRKEDTINQIDELCEKEGFYCGVILTFEDVVKILELMINTKEAVKIKYALYFNE